MQFKWYTYRTIQHFMRHSSFIYPIHSSHTISIASNAPIIIIIYIGNPLAPKIPLDEPPFFNDFPSPPNKVGFPPIPALNNLHQLNLEKNRCPTRNPPIHTPIIPICQITRNTNHGRTPSCNFNIPCLNPGIN